MKSESKQRNPLGLRVVVRSKPDGNTFAHIGLCRGDHNAKKVGPEQEPIEKLGIDYRERQEPVLWDPSLAPLRLKLTVSV